MLKGFLIQEYQERFPEAVAQITQWVQDGKIKFRENIIKGLENLPKAFIGLFKGENIGKQLVKVTD